MGGEGEVEHLRVITPGMELFEQHISRTAIYIDKN